jgi:hypothetical protein
MRAATVSAFDGRGPGLRDTKKRVLERLNVDELRDILEELRLPRSGLKGQLISRLLEDDSFDARLALAFFDEDDLVRFCEEEGFWSAGSEQELREMILEAIRAEEGDRPEPHVLLSRRLREVERALNRTPDPSSSEVARPQASSQSVDSRAAAWGIASTVSAVFAVAAFVGYVTIGLFYGLILAAVITVLAFVLMKATARRWAPWLDRFLERSE